ncbi:MAG: cell surface protein SprA [Balneolales bacterium]|nr:cell surface protein SprA [Balneolales bacterium]
MHIAEHYRWFTNSVLIFILFAHVSVASELISSSDKKVSNQEYGDWSGHDFDNNDAPAFILGEGLTGFLNPFGTGFFVAAADTTPSVPTPTQQQPEEEEPEQDGMPDTEDDEDSDTIKLLEESDQPAQDSLNVWPFPRSSVHARPFLRTLPKLLQIRLNDDRTEVERDSASGDMIVRRTITGVEVPFSSRYTFEQFAEEHKSHHKIQVFKDLIREEEIRRERRRGVLDFRITVPGGQSSAFTTIFGRPEVNLRVTGSANMNVGVSISDSEDPALPADQQRRVDPKFDQNLKLNIAGTIGDKLTISTDWDTERQFEYENRLNILYTGYEDEIIQSIELGNVSMETGNRLIRGGGSLFGIKARAKLGALDITTVVSQQESDSQTQTISGGSQETIIDIAPNQYENDRHFFLDFFSRQEFEGIMADVLNPRRLFDIINIDVYVLDISSTEQEGRVPAIALLDLGTIQTGGVFGPPNEEFDRFDPGLLNQYRDPTIPVSPEELGVASDEFEEGIFIPLQPNIDYEINENLGYISLLRARLDERQALAIAFSYRDRNTNEIVYVGDESTGSNDRLFLKLLRPSNLSTSSRAWPLTMRNVYSLNTSNLSRDNLELDVFFTGGNVDQVNIPGLNNILLQDLGLDRVDAQGNPTPDNRIDFNTFTLDPRNGRVIFPYLEPFGQRIIDIINASGLPEAEREAAINDFAFPQLYTSRPNTAGQNSRNSIYRLRGLARGGVSDSFMLGFGLIPGSVRVRANGIELSEGIDYEVDYILGNIIITNRSYLSAGQDIEVEYESNAMLQIQQTTFTGVRAQYNFTDNIRLGGTYFRLSERPIQDKIPVGDEPINNTIIGFDANARFEAPWLTRALNALPLLQTRAPSTIDLSGEWAQLRPGIAQTSAVQRAIDRNELFPDEENGLAFIDDFEGSRSTISFLNPGRWFLAAAPYALPALDPDMSNAGQSIAERGIRSDFRAQFSYYMIPTTINRSGTFFPESAEILIEDVFPNRQISTQDQRTLQTLDIYFNPHERGQYNYNMEMRNLLENRREDMWGGMTAVLPGGLGDFTQQNIEFLEFWVQPVLPDGAPPGSLNPSDYNGKIIFDIGTVTEDVIPNNTLNTEDGLYERENNLRPDNPDNTRSYVLRSPVEFNGQFSVANINREDVGLDGLPSTGNDGLNEQQVFMEFVNQMESQFADMPDRAQQFRDDPSNDNYVYYDDARVRSLPLHERFYRMYGYYERNSISEGTQRAVTNRPDSEGLLNPAVVNTENAFFQFEFNLNPADTTSLRVGQNYVVDRQDSPDNVAPWYQVRIPLRDFVRSVGSIEDLQRVTHIRMWMTGYNEPFTLRFATFEFVGNLWRKADNVGNTEDQTTIFDISTINFEENATRRPVPYRIPPGAIRSTIRGQQETIVDNEQSLVLTVENLKSQDIRMISRVYPGNLSLVNYSNMRMFVHGEGYENREDVELVVRLGRDLQNNYYEYRQPVTPTDTTFQFSNVSGSTTNRDALLAEDAQQVWLPDENSMNIVLSTFNELKQLRRLEGVPEDVIYERADILRDAVPGALVAIVGNPSLDRITEIGIGIRNPHGTGRDPNPVVPTIRGDAAVGRPNDLRRGNSQGVPNLDAQIWVNELRVSGFDNQRAWAGNVSARIQMADFATFNATFSHRQDGFGSIDSRMVDRSKSDETSYNLSTTVNLHRFIPEGYGWNIPVSLSTRNSVSTPRFLPREGDIRFSEFRSAVEADEPDPDIRDEIIRNQLEEIQTRNESYTINLTGLTKNNSRSFLLRNLVDPFTLSYNYTTSQASSPNNAFDDRWNYTAGLNYNLTFRNVETVRPLGFLEDLPVLNLISGFRLAYVPRSIGMQHTLNRSYSELQRRSFDEQPAFDLQQQHQFTYVNTFNINYDITPPISLRMNTRSEYNFDNISRVFDADSTSFNIRPTFDILNDALFDSDTDVRRESYQENYTASWRPRFNQIRSLNWLTYQANYRGGFNWRNAQQGSILGNRVGNTFGLDQTVGLRIQDLFRRVPFYDNAVRANEQEFRQREAEARRRVEQRQRAREQRRWEREKERALERGEEHPPEPASLRRGGRGSQPPAEDRTLADNVQYRLRQILLATVSMQSFDITYNTNRTHDQSGYRGGASIFDAFNESTDTNFSPDFGYRLGLSNSIPFLDLVRPEDEFTSIDAVTRITENNDLRVRTSITPFRDFRVDLDWNIRLRENRDNTLTIFQDSVSTDLRQSGGIETSVWSFGGGYRALYRRHLQTGLDNLPESGNQIISEDGDVLLSPNTIQREFRASYLAGIGGSLDSRDYLPFPMPTWRVNWGGWERRIGFLRSYVTRLTLSHNYSSNYRLDWRFFPDAGNEVSRNVGDFSSVDFRSEFEPQNITLTRSFQPLIGANFTFTNGIRATINYNQSRTTTLSLNNSNVVETDSRGVTVQIGYSKRGFRLPFFRRFSNTLDLNLNVNYAEDLRRTYALISDLADVFRGPADEIIRDADFYEPAEPTERGDARITITPSIGYTFSQTIRANFEYRYFQLSPRSSGVFPRTDQDIMFNIVITIRS